MIEVLHPQLHDHRHRVRLRIENKNIGGWLVPDLSDPSRTDRSLILVDLTSNQIPATYRREFARFTEKLGKLHQNKFTASKIAVTEIADGTWLNGPYKVGVHKMGPVPALALTADPLTIPQRPGKKSEIIVFPRGTFGPGQSDGRSKSALLDSLEVLDASAILRVYVEDIFEHLKDTSDRLGLPQCLARIKAVREIIGQSIVPKLDVLTPSERAWQLFLEDPMALAESFEMRSINWFAQNNSVVAEYLYASCVAEWCAEKFFDLLGIKFPEREIALRNRKYSLANCKSSFCVAYGLREEVFENSELVSALSEMVLLGQDADSLVKMRPEDPVVQHLRDYLIFLQFVERERDKIFADKRFASRDAIVFISRRFESKYGNFSVETLKRVVEMQSGGTSRVTTFIGEGGEPLKASVKAQLWLADSVWSLIPEHDQEVGKDLKWIYLEAEHAFVSRKPMLCISRDRQDLIGAITQMQMVQSPMLADNVIVKRNQIRKETLNQFRENVAIIAANYKELEEKMRLPLERVRASAAHTRRTSLLEGVLHLFQPDDILVFRLLFERFGDFEFKKSDVKLGSSELRFSKASSFDNAFRNAHNRTARYPILVDNKAHVILRRIPKTTKYRLGLVDLARALAHSKLIEYEEVKNDIQSAFNAIVS